MKNNLKKVSFLIYVALLYAPISLHLSAESANQNTENRILNKLPSWPQTMAEMSLYPAKMEAYFEDHFGMRERYIKTANRVRYNLFNDFVSNQITGGDDGYIFFNSHNSLAPNALIKTSCGLFNVTEAAQVSSTTGFKILLDYLRENASHAAVSVVPIKARIYPEKLPPLERHWCSNGATQWSDQLLEKLKLAGYDVFNPFKLMTSLKSEIPVYLPSYFHWHGEAPKRVAIAMMESLWNLSSFRFDIKPEIARPTSDLRAYLLGLKKRENSVKYDYQAHGVKSCDSGRCIPELDQYFNHQSLAYTYQSEPKTGRTLLIVSDSFGAYIAPHFIRGFDYVVQVDISDIKLEKLLSFHEHMFENYQPTHVLKLFHDGGLWRQDFSNKELKKQLNIK